MWSRQIETPDGRVHIMYMCLVVVRARTFCPRAFSMCGAALYGLRHACRRTSMWTAGSASLRCLEAVGCHGRRAGEAG